jgi:hypothetical protein
MKAQLKAHILWKIKENKLLKTLMQSNNLELNSLIILVKGTPL